MNSSIKAIFSVFILVVLALVASLLNNSPDGFSGLAMNHAGSSLRSRTAETDKSRILDYYDEDDDEEDDDDQVADDDLEVGDDDEDDDDDDDDDDEDDDSADAKKDGNWGFDYYNETAMLDMSNFGSDMLVLHSQALKKKTREDEERWEKEDIEMRNEMENYDPYDGGSGYKSFSTYYEDNSTFPTVKVYNLDNEFAVELYKDHDIVSNAIKGYWNGWETETVEKLNKAFQEYSKEHDIPLNNLTFIDIGANLGWLSLNMAALGVKVLAFEPMEENLQHLKQTLKKKVNVENGISDRITLYEYGLGVKEETCFIYSDNENIGDGHVKCVEKESDVKVPANYTLRGNVPLKRLDDVVNADGMHIVAVKLDSEGFEGNIFEGGEKVLLGGNVDMIMMEFVPDWITDKGGDPLKLMESITTAGYRAAKKDNFGYMRKKTMLNMTNFGPGKDDVVFHSPKLVKEFMGEE